MAALFYVSRAKGEHNLLRSRDGASTWPASGPPIFHHAQSGVSQANSAMGRSAEALSSASEKVAQLRQGQDVQQARAAAAQAALGALQRRSTEARRQSEALSRAALLAHRLALGWLEQEAGNDPASLSLAVRESAQGIRQATELALLEPGALDRRWFDTDALDRTVRRLAAQHPDQPAASALSEAGARLSEHGNAFVGLLCNGQIEQAQQLSQQLESEREAVVTHLAALLATA